MYAFRTYHHEAEVEKCSFFVDVVDVVVATAVVVVN